MEDTAKMFAHGRVLILEGTSPARVAARAMADRKVGSVLVSDGRGNITGIVTDRDLACRLVGEDRPSLTQLHEIMTTPLLAVSEDSKITDVIDVMINAGVRRVPIMKKDEADIRQCAGMVSLDDLLLTEVLTPRQLRAILETQLVGTESRAEPGPRGAEIKIYLGDVGENMGERARFSESKLEELSIYVLARILGRIPFTAAAHALQRLPRELKNAVIEEMPRLNHFYMMRDLLGELEEKFQIEGDQREQAVKSCWEALGRFMDSDDKEYVLDRLPRDFKEVLHEFPRERAARVSSPEIPAGYGAT